MSTRKVYPISCFHIEYAFETHGIEGVDGRDCTRVIESMSKGQRHTVAGLKFQPIKDDKFRVYDVRGQ